MVVCKNIRVDFVGFGVTYGNIIIMAALCRDFYYYRRHIGFCAVGGNRIKVNSKCCLCLVFAFQTG